MRRLDRGTVRAAGFVALLTAVFVMVNSQVVYAAAGSSGGSGDLLAPLNITSSEGVPIDGYELTADGGSIVAFTSQALAFALSGLFTLIRLLVGLAGWAIELAFRFPLLKILLQPAQKTADAYEHVVVDTLGLKGLLLAWAFVFASFMIVRGKVGRGLGEIFLTLLLGALAASVFVRPDYLLAPGGPLGQGQQVAAEVAQQSVNSYDWGGKIASRGPCDGMAGNAERACLERQGEGPVSAAEVARPIQDSITNALIVKPYMLLQYGRILDPGKPSDRAAYAVHLKWITGGYQPGATSQSRRKACSLVHGPGKQYCERDTGDGPHRGSGLPSLTPGGELLDTASPLVTEEDQQFAAFLADLKKAGPVGKDCADYAQEPTWWRVGGAVLLLIAALFICGMLLSCVIVLLGTQGICAAAAAAGGVTFIAGMLPGPARQAVWKWLSWWGIAVLAMVGVCAFIPFFGIAVDATITNGPDLVVERILLIDVLAIAGTAGHRRLLAGVTSFGRRMALRMRYAKVGGTHLPGDTSDLGAALALNSPTLGMGGGLRTVTGGGRYSRLGTRHRLMNALAAMADGTGMPVDTGRMLVDATAEAGRGLAPLTAAAVGAGMAARLSVKGAHGLLIGSRPDEDRLARWRKPTAGGDTRPGGPPGSGGPAGPGSSGGPGGRGGSGPGRPGGPADRYRNPEGRIIDPVSGRVLHDQNTDRTLLSTRAHNRLVRYRGYRILHRTGRAAYGTTVDLPAGLRRAGSGGSRYAQDARQQVRVWGNTLREDGRAWADAGRHASRVVREESDDRGGMGPFLSGRLPTRTSPAAPPRNPTTRPGTPPPPPTSAGSSPAPTPAPGPGTAAGASPRPEDGPVLPGGRGAGRATRDQARARFQDLLRRTAPDAERRRQEQARRRGQGGEGA
ncbi:hypothetical protein BX257_9150 [Streptomyces sp. 3212.3]|uniref:hypothetical protein n=1 Tax=Streptomyces sp. 3212.3 TaxID=1938846 RepID=UPI000E238ACF|nr:hypothetical protein [Streptomyces sp. 3212.3]REE66319.1 hypothetical protein BX257_9150 [Streptomyces sp. 3212.3]